MTSDTSNANPMGELLKELAEEFWSLCNERHWKGQEKYGAFSFLGKDMFEEMAFELADLVNYATYQFIKLRLMTMFLMEDPRMAALANDEGEVTIGAGNFFTAGSFTSSQFNTDSDSGGINAGS